MVVFVAWFEQSVGVKDSTRTDGLTGQLRTTRRRGIDCHAWR